MILADTSIWIDHLRGTDDRLGELLDAGEVYTHSFVIGEFACGNLHNRNEVLGLMQRLPHAPVASQDEVLFFIDNNKLMGRGLGFVDMHLLASTALSNSVRLWSRDKRLAQVAADLNLNDPD